MDIPKPELHPNIHKLVISQALSKLGDNFTEVALALFVLGITHSVADLGIVLAMTYLPSIVLGWAVAGVIDRFNKRRALIVSDVARALLVASIPVVRDYDWTVAAVFMMYSFAMVYRPMIRAVQPQIAGGPAINARSGARQQTYYSMADVGAYLAAAGVLFLWGVAPAFWIDAATYAAAAALVAAINVPKSLWKPTVSGAGRFWEQLSEGYRYLRSHPLVAQLTLVSASVTIGVGALNTFTAPLSKSFWHVSSHHYVWLMLAMALGGLVSGWILEKYALMERLAPRPIIATGLVLTGLGYGLTLAAPSWWVGMVCLFVVGLGNGVYGTAIMVWVQQATPEGVRARVLSIRGIGLGVGGALGAWLGGQLAQSAGLPTAVVAASVLWVVVAFWMFSSRALGRSGWRRPAA